MTEQDVREGLHGAVAGEPPLDFDPDALVTTARREVRRRRALVSASLATAAIAVAAVAVPVALGISRDQGGVAPAERPPATSVEPSRPTPWPPASTRSQVYTAAELHQRGDQMRARLKVRLAEIVPDATEVLVQPFGGEALGDVDDGQNYLNTFAGYTLDGVRFAIGVNVFAPGAHPQGPAELCEPDPDSCAFLGGQRLVVDQSAGQADPTLRLLSVYDFRPDGSVVSVVGYNYDPTGAPLPDDAPPMPVTAEQLAELAVDPAIGL